MSPPSSPTRTPSTAGGLRRGEGLRLLRWPTAPSSSMGSIRFRSGGAAREAAAGTLGSISGFPSVAPKARIWRTFWVQFYGCLGTSSRLARPRSRSSCTVFGFCYLFVWGYIADLSMVPRLRRGRLAGRALSHPFILRGQKRSNSETRWDLGTCVPALHDLGVRDLQSVSPHPSSQPDKTTLTLTRNLGPGALFTRARDVQTGLPGESEWRGSRLAQQRERCALHGGT